MKHKNAKRISLPQAIRRTSVALLTLPLLIGGGGCKKEPESVDVGDGIAYFEELVGESFSPVKGTDDRIYKLSESGLMVRVAVIKGNGKGAPVKLLQITDMHLSCMDETDLATADPAVMSSYEHRTWCKDKASLANAERALSYAPFFDKTILTGDNIDYLTHGSLSLLQATVWGKYDNVLVTPGGHDVTRVMQGTVKDEHPETARQIYEAAIPNPSDYFSEILSGRVMLIGMDNGEGSFTKAQAEKLAADIEKARAEDLTVLIFQHEPICTHNPKTADVKPIRVNDGSGTRDFYRNFIGSSNQPDKSGVCKLIRSSDDVIKGVFCGHWHSDFEMEISAQSGGTIPQYVLTGCPYDKGHAFFIVVE